VVIADRFPDSQVPRWADEGMAILADSAQKQERHFVDLRTAHQRGSLFRLNELFSLEAYPQGRWDTFYGQSASLVRFLVERDTHQQFIEFVARANDHGYDRALRDIYQIDGAGDLERQWRAALRDELASDQPTSRSVAASNASLSTAAASPF
jgi:hypothetical protein